jgi:NRAMP (natural resistance-associated macrophage protein)-like metal ion transporter
LRPNLKISRLKEIASALGPGLITGASDDDPSGIATYSQAGVQFGYGMLWTMLFSFPFMCAIQEISGRIGRVTGHGIAGNIRRHYSKSLLYGIVAILFAANTLNLGADLGAMAAGLQLVIGGPALAYVLGLGILSLVAEIFIPYKTYVFYLKWLTLVLFAYVATVFAVQVPWGEVLKGTLRPSLIWNAKGLAALMAILGTTISPYLFFWQASEEAEEVQDRPAEHALRKRPLEAPAQLRRIRLDTYVGMAFSNAVGFFIILTAAVTLHAHGAKNIETAAEAALALKPLAGRFAYLLFTLGIIGTGLLAVPVLAGSAAYAVGEALRLPVSLQRSPKRAKWFYVILAISIVLGMLFNVLRLNVIQTLYWTAVLNGVVAVPVIVMMMRLTHNPKVMGGFAIPNYLRIVGWITCAIMAAATIGLCVSWGR